MRTQNLFKCIIHQAEILGMQVNTRKTESLYIWDLKSYLPAAYFHDANGTKIVAGTTMNILGFHLSASPDMSAQVESIKRKFMVRIWILRHLYVAGFSQEDLLHICMTVILPVHNYCSAVYRLSLKKIQTSALERLQAQALKAIFGYEHPYWS